MKKSIRTGVLIVRGATSRCGALDRKHPAESYEHAHGIAAGQVTNRRVPSIHEFLLVVRRPQIRTKLGGGIIVEPEISSRESFFQNCHSSEQAHGSSFDCVRRRKKNFAIPFKKSSRDPTHHILSEADHSVFERNLNAGAIQGRSSNLIDTVGVEPCLAELQVKSLGRLLCRFLPLA